MGYDNNLTLILSQKLKLDPFVYILTKQFSILEIMCLKIHTDCFFDICDLILKVYKNLITLLKENCQQFDAGEAFTVSNPFTSYSGIGSNQRERERERETGREGGANYIIHPNVKTVCEM